jgi:xanthine dehydrogenase molybdopterin-binding subunit B
MHHGALALIVAMLVTSPVAAASGSDQQAAGATVRTAKERLTDKAADEQRVDDCKVPPPRRTRARPTGCGLPRE